MGEQVRVLLRRADGSCFRACVKCSTELDVSKGEWVAEFPSREPRGYLVSQLICPMVDPADILAEYETSRFPDVFYNLRLGVPYTDLERRLEAAFVLSLCGTQPMLERSEESCLMGVDTGSLLYATILRQDEDDYRKYHLVKIAVCRQFEQLDDLMRKFHVSTCIVDGLPEQHATRAFAERHPGKVLLHYFNENQRGAPSFDRTTLKVESNRTEALDASRSALRDRLVVLPRQDPLLELFATHMSADARKLEQDPATGVEKYRYFRTGDDHLSMAFTYVWLATLEKLPSQGVFDYYRMKARKIRNR